MAVDVEINILSYSVQLELASHGSRVLATLAGTVEIGQNRARWLVESVNLTCITRRNTRCSGRARCEHVMHATVTKIG